MTEHEIHKKIIIPLFKMFKKTVKLLPTQHRHKAMTLIKMYMVESAKYFKEKKKNASNGDGTGKNDNTRSKN